MGLLLLLVLVLVLVLESLSGMGSTPRLTHHAPKENQHYQLFVNRVEVVLDTRWNEHRAPRTDRTILAAHLENAPTLHDVIQLIPSMRRVVVYRASRQNEHTSAHRRNLYEFKIPAS
jgi:hypothetical protein